MFASIIISLAAILIAISLYSISRQKAFMEGYLKGFNETMSEAAAVKEDLEEMMEKAIEISQDMVNDMSLCWQKERSEEMENQPAQEKKNDLCTSANSNGKVRIYELSRLLGIPTKELLALIRKLGIPAVNHMKTLNEMEIALLKESISTNALQTEKKQVPYVQTNDDMLAQEKDHGTWSIKKTQPDVTTFGLDEIKSAHPYLATRTLVEQGYTIAQIAQILGRGQGEISLILNLTNKKHASK